MTFKLVLDAIISFLVLWAGMRLSPLGTSATNWRNVPVLDDK
jgi:hypothetical protein